MVVVVMEVNLTARPAAVVLRIVYKKYATAVSQSSRSSQQTRPTTYHVHHFGLGY